MYITYLILLALATLIGYLLGKDYVIKRHIVEVSDYEIPNFIDCEDCNNLCEIGMEGKSIYSCGNEDCHSRYAIIDVLVEKIA